MPLCSGHSGLALVLSLALLLGTLGGIEGFRLPFRFPFFDAGNGGVLYEMNHGAALNARQTAKPSLRVMGLGASIMYGLRSHDGNGCRKGVRDALRFQGFEVDMVGNNANGTMADNDVTAVPGYVLTQIRDEMKASVGYKPNVVMINGGTNDADLVIDIPNAGSRMKDILEVILNTPTAPNPDACVILSLLLPSSHPKGSVQSVSINNQYKDVWAEYQAMGKCIYLADTRVIDPATGQTWIQLGADIHTDDGIHPTDAGYQKMASIMYNDIMAAYKDGKIKEPQPVDLSANKGCPKKYADSVKIGGMTQLGSGYDDSIYHHDSSFQGTVLTINSSFDRDQWFTARLFSPDKHDILGWYNASETQHMFAVWKNTGTASKAA